MVCVIRAAGSWQGGWEPISIFQGVQMSEGVTAGIVLYPLELGAFCTLPAKGNDDICTINGLLQAFPAGCLGDLSCLRRAMREISPIVGNF